MWMLAKTKSNQEKRAKINLINQGFMCYLPILNTKKHIKNTWMDIKEAMFSGYLFIKFAKNIKNLHKINNTFGVNKLLINKDTGMPYIINDHDMDIIQEVVKFNNNNEFAAGDSVIVNKGKLSKFAGVFLERCSKYRAKLLINIINNNQEVVVNIKDIQKVY